MKAVITGEMDNLVGVNLRDNNGAEHIIEMKPNGEITAHQQDGYSDDPSKRTEEENEHVNQARRFARYWVYRKRGYDTLEGRKNPDRLLASVVAIAPLTPDSAETYFGDLYRHFETIYGDAESESPVEMPDGVAPKDAVYQQELYLGIDDGLLDAAAARAIADPDLMDLIGHSVGVGGDRPDAAEFVPKFHEIVAEAADVDPDSLPSLREGLLIDAVSDVHVQYSAGGNERTTYGDRPDRQRGPDARIETYPFEADSITDLQTRLAKHLVCQVRDCYLLMGIAPPEPFRIQGYGRRKATGWYNTIDLYDEYADPVTNVDTWFEEHTPEDAYEHDADGAETQSTG